MVKSTASAVWEGGLKTGNGKFMAASNAFSGAYSAATRFEGATGTNPEELIAAAHAACLSMALAAGLERAGTPSVQDRGLDAPLVELVPEGAPGDHPVGAVEVLLPDRGRLVDVAVDVDDQVAVARGAAGRGAAWGATALRGHAEPQ